MKILLFGGSGMLGTELVKNNSEIIAPSRVGVDITGNELELYIRQNNPDIIINAAAETDNRKIEKVPSEAIKTNIIGSANIAIICRELGIRYVYISTDYIYPGTRGNYTELDPILPFNLYSWTKLGGECSAVAVKNHLIIRTSFGKNTFDYSEAFSDKWVSKDYVDVIAPMIYEAAISPLTGVLNIGTERKTIYEYAKQRSPNVKPIKIEERSFMTPYDNSFNLQKWMNYKNKKSIAKTHNECRICGSNKLIKYLDLGLMPLANNLEFTAIRAKEVEQFPLQVLFCEECGLSQLSVVIDPGKMFSYYTYRSSVNAGYVKHCKEMAIQLKDKFNLSKDSFHIDLAGNDGTLLRQFKDAIGLKVLNIDPATNLVAIAEASGIESVSNFFGLDVAENVLKSHGQADLITATNVFAHVDNVKDFILSAKKLLKPNGILVLEFPYLIDFIEGLEFDTCFLPGTTILGPNKNIENCEIGDSVFSFDGKMTKIKYIMSRNYNGKILHIKPEYLEEFKCTPNHPILVAEKNKNGIMKRKWIMADRISIGDYVCVPKIKHTNSSHIKIDLGKYNKYGPNWRRGLESVIVDESFAYLIGLYTADGSSNVDTMSIALGKHEKSTIGRKLIKCIKKLGIKPRVIDRTPYGSKCDLYNFSCVALQRLFKDVIGKTASVKVVPDFILNSNKEIKESYLMGLFDGDGYYKNGQLHLHTTSKILAHQVQLMFASLDIMMGISYTPPAPYLIIGVSGFTKGSYQLIAKSELVRKFNYDNKKTKFNKRYLIDDDYIYVKINKINKKQYSGKVYNFETKNNTYLVSNLAVHNCYFEHLSYFSILPLMRLCDIGGMKIVSVEKQNIHGGTVRVTIAKIDSNIEIEESVHTFVNNELKLDYDKISKYTKWATLVGDSISEFSMNVMELKKKGYKIAAFAASAKGNTLLNSASMNTDIINYIADETPEKIGKFSPLTGIPIVNKQMLVKDPPDYLIILSWNFKDEIMEKLNKIYKGKYIIPIPKFTIQ